MRLQRPWAVVGLLVMLALLLCGEAPSAEDEPAARAAQRLTKRRQCGRVRGRVVDQNLQLRVAFAP